jgi:hypothetical protein
MLVGQGGEQPAEILVCGRLILRRGPLNLKYVLAVKALAVSAAVLRGNVTEQYQCVGITAGELLDHPDPGALGQLALNQAAARRLNVEVCRQNGFPRRYTRAALQLPGQNSN